MAAPSVVPKVTIRFDGPFFERDPAKLVRQNIREMLVALVAEGEADVKDHYPTVTGHGREGVRGRVASLSGRRWNLFGVISETYAYAWRRGGQKRYLGGKTEARYHMFRRTNQRIRSMRAVLSADLSAGLD